ncbi:MAG: class I SAM-dependent methyltransferase [Clostridiales bacterium]|nr:class I SAM-dependent methyltransferase [Clostridiales bacterium]
MTEQIGKIVLDYKYYPGEDFYCDGEVENELLDIVKNYSSVEYRHIIEERAKWPVLYHLSPLRENIVDWIPMDKSAKVLEVGAGCGAITGSLAKKAGSVTCIDLSKKRSLINAYRNQECDNVAIHVGNFKDIEPGLPCDFDYIYFIGVFEYGQSYIGTAHPYEDLLRMMMRHLKKNGRIIIAIENRLGLKYFAGCREDHLGTYFSGVEDYAQGGGVRTFTREGLEKIFKSCGVGKYSFYYPYPDYKFMTALYSDDRLPQPGELSENIRNFDRDRLLLFDEKQAFDGVVRDGLFPIFSNSYVAVIGEGFDVKYAKYSNDRAPEYAIRTEICIGEDGKKVVKKYAMSDEAAEHIRSMETAYIDLRQRFEGGKLEVNKCRLCEDGMSAEFEYIEGMTLEEILDRCLEENEIEKFHALFKEYLERISYHEEMPVADYDLIFANILITPPTVSEETEKEGTGYKGLSLETIKDAVWTIIDYEWTFGKPVTAKETAFRAVYCYVLENEKRNKLNLDAIIDTLGITEREAEEFRGQEMEFQEFVTGKHKSMAQMRDILGYRIMEPLKWVHKFDDSSAKERIQIYEDRGNGYNEEDSYFVKDAYEGENLIRLELEADGNVSMLRIDPAMDYCVVRIRELLFNGESVELNKKNVITNGKNLKDGSYLFATDDPNINIKISNLNRKDQNILEAEMEIVRIPAQIALDMAGAVKKLW